MTVSDSTFSVPSPGSFGGGVDDAAAAHRPSTATSSSACGSTNNLDGNLNERPRCSAGNSNLIGGDATGKLAERRE